MGLVVLGRYPTWEVLRPQMQVSGGPEVDRLGAQAPSALHILVAGSGVVVKRQLGRPDDFLQPIERIEVLTVGEIKWRSGGAIPHL